MPAGRAAPEWQAYTMPNYDAAMTRACTELQKRILADPAYRSSILTDPRDLHRALFAEFTPHGFPEYAGTALLQRLAAVRGRLSLCADQAAAAKW
ncbi:hypothetical protein O4H52_17665, partial [Sphingomonadaceae bacterium G21617-S1]|nr:hypothetical protein [Sphingomonadaceae bacterium G21617-S1]